MRKLFYLVVLFSTVAKAQIVNIPDANFKTKLLSALPTNQVAKNLLGTYFKIDSNNDGEIQDSEALQVSALDISSSSINGLTGIASFVNLKELNCAINNINNLSLDSNINLKKLVLNWNQFSALNFTNLTNLEQIDCGQNPLTTVDVSGLVNLTYLNCGNSGLDQLLLVGAVNLIYLNCYGTDITTLDVSQLTSLTELYVHLSHLSSLNVTNLVNLQKLYIGQTQISSIDLSNNVNLIDFDAQAALLTSLDMTACPSLQRLEVRSNLLSTLNISGLTQLNFLDCYNNPLPSLDLTTQSSLVTFDGQTCHFTTIDLSNSPLVQQVLLSENLLTELDLSNNPVVQNCGVRANPNLISVNLKNGGNSTGFDFTNCLNLHFVCADEGEIVAINNANQTNNVTGIVVNSYCSFTPGGNYNTITGAVTFDADNNGCDPNDIFQPNIRVDIIGEGGAGASYTSNSGVYTFYTPTGNFVITPSLENPSWYNVTPAPVIIPFANNNNNSATQNFCITANGSHQDLEIVIVPIIPARPGFDAVYKLVYRNKGNVSISNWTGLTLNYDSTKMTFISASQMTTNSGVGFLDFGYSVNPFESNSIEITFKINSPIATEPTNIGDLLSFTALLDPVITDENPSDNSFQYNQTVVGSFDPNEVTCLEGNSVSPTEIGDYLHYAINFENTGTADAENIVVKDIMNSSAPVIAKLTGNVAEFIFQNISLHSGGHGNILIKVKSKNTLVEGNTVSKKASIYFDYNAPVNTNMEITTFQTLSATVQEIDASISIYPNPTKGTININCNNTIQSVQLYDVQGRVLETDIVNETSKVIDISNKAKGVYFFKILSDKGSKVEKIIKD
jgi:uncharacterized repeat protein (TIGR01451 family)